MKMKFTLIAATAALGMIGSTNAAVVAVGVDTTTTANWRTAATLETDNEYGTDGYILFGFASAENTYVSPYPIPETHADTLSAIPAGMVLSSNYNGSMWSGNGNFGQMEDPTAGNALTSVGLLANPSAATAWTLTRPVATSFRMTLLLATGDNENQTHQATVNDGSGAVSTAATAHTVNGLHYHVFDIDAGTTDITFSNTPTNRSLTGIAFDNVVVPEPSSALFVGLGAIGFCLRRKR